MKIINCLLSFYFLSPFFSYLFYFNLLSLHGEIASPYFCFFSPFSLFSLLYTYSLSPTYLFHGGRGFIWPRHGTPGSRSFFIFLFLIRTPFPFLLWFFLLTLKIAPSQHTSEGLGRPRGLTRPAMQQETKRNRRNRSRDR
jgi:hypothetical protein